MVSEVNASVTRRAVAHRVLDSRRLHAWKQHILAAIASRIEGVDSLVEWTGHLRIDAAEVAAGLSKVRLFASCSALCIKNLTQHFYRDSQSKPREKIVTVEELLRVSQGASLVP